MTYFEMSQENGIEIFVTYAMLECL